MRTHNRLTHLRHRDRLVAWDDRVDAVDQQVGEDLLRGYVAEGTVEADLRAYRRQLRNLEKEKVEVFRDVLDE